MDQLQVTDNHPPPVYGQAVDHNNPMYQEYSQQQQWQQQHDGRDYDHGAAAAASIRSLCPEKQLITSYQTARSSFLLSAAPSGMTTSQKALFNMFGSDTPSNRAACEAEVAHRRCVREVCHCMLPGGYQLALQGWTTGRELTGEVFQVVVQRLLGVGGYGAAWLVGLIGHTPKAAAAAGRVGGVQAAGSSSSSFKRPAVQLPEQMVLKVALPESALTERERAGMLPGDWRRTCRDAWQREHAIMSACHPHSHMLGCYGWGSAAVATGEQQDWVLMEYAPHGSLQQQLVGPEGKAQGLSPQWARLVVRDVIEGMSWAASRARVIHRDIKPENIFLCDRRSNLFSHHCPWLSKVGDWGIAKQLETPADFGRTLVCTPVYRAPELREGYTHDVRMDTWQIGLLLLHIRLGLPPFFYLYSLDISEEERERRRSGEELDNDDSPYKSLLLPVEKEFVKACLQKNVAARPTPDGLRYERYYRDGTHLEVA